MQEPPPTCSAMAISPLKHHCYHGCQLSVYCCVFPLNGSQLWPEPGTFLYFLMGLFLVPKTKEPTVVRAIPMPHDLHGPIGIIGAKIWGHGECCHGERGPNLLEGRLAAAHDIAVCCGCVLGCDLC